MGIYPPIPWEIVADHKRSAEHSLGTTAARYKKIGSA
jgi:hypothetical protein